MNNTLEIRELTLEEVENVNGGVVGPGGAIIGGILGAIDGGRTNGFWGGVAGAAAGAASGFLGGWAFQLGRAGYVAAGAAMGANAIAAGVVAGEEWN